MKEWRPDKKGWIDKRHEYLTWNTLLGITVENTDTYEAGASAMLKALKPLILEIAPSSKLVDILYKEK